MLTRARNSSEIADLFGDINQTVVMIGFNVMMIRHAGHLRASEPNELISPNIIRRSGSAVGGDNLR